MKTIRRKTIVLAFFEIISSRLSIVSYLLNYEDFIHLIPYLYPFYVAIIEFITFIMSIISNWMR